MGRDVILTNASWSRRRRQRRRGSWSERTEAEYAARRRLHRARQALVAVLAFGALVVAVLTAVTVAIAATPGWWR